MLRYLLILCVVGALITNLDLLLPGGEAVDGDFKIRPSGVTVEKNNTVYEFSRESSARSEKYMIVQGGYGFQESEFSFSNQLSLLTLKEAAELSRTYGDIFQCRSEGWRAARNSMLAINILPRNDHAMDAFTEVIDAHRLEQKKAEGMRVCIELNSEELTLARKQSTLAFTKPDSTQLIGIGFEILNDVRQIPCR